MAADLLVYDEPEECPYLPGHTARLPLRLPSRRITGTEFDARLARGERRSGLFVYAPRCPGCRACEALRVDVERFSASRSQRRVWRRGSGDVRATIGPPQVDAERVHLFNEHRRQRHLDHDGQSIDETSYAEAFARSCCDTLEISYHHQGRLLGVAICDRGQTSLSAVYFYFDPAFSRLSPGTFSILKLIELARKWQMQYVYLGFYIAQSAHMSYKSQFLPHERLRNGVWQRFERTP